ncbi:hypothetical protein V8G54_021702 [Vigna mungo]|uniref:Uncharacterized protein n=1 Tax=Vigna mungo TaxID=3915 RepID=A0AAQ3RXW8_VIGMU
MVCADYYLTGMSLLAEIDLVEKGFIGVEEGSSTVEDATMSMAHLCSSSTCNACGRKHFRSAASSHGDGGWNKKYASLICHYGEKTVLRTAKTMKNRGKLWGVKMEDATSSSGLLIRELKKVLAVRLVKTFENQGVKQIFDVQKAVMGLQSWMKYLVVVVSVVFIMNMIIIAMLMGRVLGNVNVLCSEDIPLQMFKMFNVLLDMFNENDILESMSSDYWHLIEGVKHYLPKLFIAT